MTRILIVEDNADLAYGLRTGLEIEGYDVDVAEDGPGGLARAQEWLPHLMILDLMLPGMDGYRVLRTLREQGHEMPVLMLTARGEEADKVLGFRLGADDYVTKPFSPRELVARVRAVLRRGHEPEEVASTALEGGPVRMDVDRHVVTVDGSEVRLPLKEFELLEMFLRNPGRVLTRGQLIDRVWGSDYVGDTKTLDVHVKRLRAKIETDPGAPRFIVTVRGLGYKFDPEGAE
jgi:two-component system, OmpR family, response regulator RegX3